MTDTTTTTPTAITSFPNYGSYFSSFPYQNLNSQFAASMQPFGGGYGGWGAGQMQGGASGWPSLFGPGYASPQYNNMFGSMSGYGMGSGIPFGMGVGSAMQQFGQMPGTQAASPSAALTQTPQPSQATSQSFGAAPSWSAAQLAQANGLSPGLADFMLQHNAGADSNPANQQFYQAAGFTNPAGSQQMLNQAGRDWTLNNNQTYGNVNADAGQVSSGPRMAYGMTSNGTPYSYAVKSGLANNPAFQRWAQTGQGLLPQGVTLYSQFGPGG